MKFNCVTPILMKDLAAVEEAVNLGAKKVDADVVF
jgi:hypothetical protein